MRQSLGRFFSGPGGRYRRRLRRPRPRRTPLAADVDHSRALNTRERTVPMGVYIARRLLISQTVDFKAHDSHSMRRRQRLERRIHREPNIVGER